MGFIKELIAKFKAKNEKERLLEEDMRIQERVQEKQKSANERELERYMKENRERQIEARVKVLRQRQSKEIWKANLLKHNNVRRGIHNNILHEKKKFLRGNVKW